MNYWGGKLKWKNLATWVAFLQAKDVANPDKPLSPYLQFRERKCLQENICTITKGNKMRWLLE